MVIGSGKIWIMSKDMDQENHYINRKTSHMSRHCRHSIYSCCTAIYMYKLFHVFQRLKEGKKDSVRRRKKTDKVRRNKNFNKNLQFVGDRLKSLWQQMEMHMHIYKESYVPSKAFAPS